VAVFDHAGHLRVLLDEVLLPSGTHEIGINTRSPERNLASGGYFYRIVAAEGTESGRFVVAK
jgi:hypothetical protein